MGCFKSTVKNWKRKFNAENEGGQVAGDRRKSNGRKWKVSDEEMTRVVAYKKEHSFVPVKGLQDTLGLPIGYRALYKYVKTLK